MEHLLAQGGLALSMVLQPSALVYLMVGVIVGMFLGIVPGFSGVTGMVLLLPFVFQVGPAEGMSLLLGMYVATTVTDTIPAVMLGVPGTASAQAIIVDGYPMAKKGLADRALSAAYSADLVGALVGVALFFALYPVLTAITMAFGSPEYLALGFMGVCMIGLVSDGGKSVGRGLIVGFFGLLLSAVGLSMHTGLPRYTFGFHYLWDGLHVVPVILGLFALPEIVELYARNTSIARTNAGQTGGGGTVEGFKDAARHWALVLRSSFIGAVTGVMPALGGPVAQWLAYGAAKQMARDNTDFGRGDVRGVMAPQAAVAANKPGALIPTLVFGVPGDVVMAVLLGAFLIIGIRPGPDMIGINLHMTIAMMLIVIFGNVLAVALALSLGRVFLRVSHIEPTILAPFLLAFMAVGCFVATGSFGDLIVFALFGLVGLTLDRAGWPKIPLVLGFVLGPILETYLFISYDAYGFQFLMRPVVVGTGVLIVVLLVFPHVSRRMRRYLSEKQGE